MNLADKLRALPLHQLEKKDSKNRVLAEEIFKEILKVYNEINSKKEVNYLGPLVLGDQLKVAGRETEKIQSGASVLAEAIKNINNLI
ncbi:MAG: hypothetical protein ACO4AN_03665 [Candidatus Nanopelagicales bacterium]